MQFTTLSNTTTCISKTCLGTMSFGAHVSEKTAIKIMDKALELRINFFDTAEMYSVPPSKETYGVTEKIIGRWMKSRNTRNKIILASKINGPSRGGDNYVRDGDPHFDRKNITQAIENSLKRLQTDYIDLYQLHWPDRNVNKFGQRSYIHDENEKMTPIEETLSVLKDLQKQGKIKHFGVSNETPWGTMEFLRIAKEKNLPRIVSIQNNYSLLTRTYDTGMAEISHRENVGLLAYSPLGYGVLGGHYLDGNKPKIGRFVKYPDFVPRYRSKKVENIVKKYKALAEKNNMTLPELACAFVYSRPFVTSNIIGPSNVAQLIECTNAINIKLSNDILNEIEKIHEECPNPCA